MAEPLNEKKTVITLNDIDSVVLTLADGSIGRISKADLIAVIIESIPDGTYNQRGLVNNDLFLDRSGISSTRDFDEILEPGMYQMSGYAPNNPSGGWGVLIVYRAATYVVQMVCSITNPDSLRIRTKIVGGDFKEWRKFSFV